MKNYHSLFMGFMKLDGWPHMERSGGQTGLAQLPVPPSTGHKCHVISEEPSHEVEVDNINEMMVDNKRLDSALTAKLFQLDNVALLEKRGGESLELNIDNRNSGSRLWNKNEMIKPYSCTVSENIPGGRNNKLWDTKWNQDSSEIKSGLLVLIQSQNNFWDSAVNPAMRSAAQNGCASDKILCQRCPVLVQIHQRSFQRYAIITRAGHQPTSHSIYLKLKKSKVTTSKSCPCQFLVTFDNSEGQSYRFEASNRQSAQEWIKAFTSQVHNFPLKTKKGQDVFHGLEILPESPVEYEEPAEVTENVCVASHSPKKRLMRQSSLNSPRVMPTLSESVDEEDSIC